jgi:hypothetical protein
MAPNITDFPFQNVRGGAEFIFKARDCGALSGARSF